MPVIAGCAGFHIHGGNFYEVAGDVNLQTHGQLGSGWHQADTGSAHPMLLDPGSGRASAASELQNLQSSSEGYHRELPGVSRIPRHIAAPVVPYGAFKSHPTSPVSYSSDASLRPRLSPRSSEGYSRPLLSTSSALILSKQLIRPNPLHEPIPDRNPSISPLPLPHGHL
jgi:hypothetical protein